MWQSLRWIVAPRLRVMYAVIGSPGSGPVMSPPEYPYRPNAGGDDAAGNPTSRIADLSNPILTPWAIEQMNASGDKPLFLAVVSRG